METQIKAEGCFVGRHRFGMAAFVLSAVMFSGMVWAQVKVPGCDELAVWAVKLDHNDMWKPNSIGSRTEIPALLASDETTALFGVSMLHWSDADVKGIRDAVLACRRATKDKSLLSSYNAMQSALISRVGNYLQTLAKARPVIPQSMEALTKQAPSLEILRLQAALAQSASAAGYQQAQRAANHLPASALQAARNLLAAMRDLPQNEINDSVVSVATASADAMREEVAATLVKDLNQISATGPGLQTLDQLRQALPREYAGALGEKLKTVVHAVDQRRTAASEEITAALVSQIQSSTPDLQKAFADIDMRMDEAILPRLTPEQAHRVREAAQARRVTVAEALFSEWQTTLNALPTELSSLEKTEALEVVVRSWPASANAFKPRFLEAIEAKRVAISTSVKKTS